MMNRMEVLPKEFLALMKYGTTPITVFTANGMRILERGYRMSRKGYWRYNFQKGSLQFVKK